MSTKQQLEKLATEINEPCVTISFNTHRTHPEHLQDEIRLKNLLKEAENRVIEEYGKRPAADLLEKLETIADEVDIQYNLDSLNLFLSNDTKEIIKSTWETAQEGVHISDSFAVRPLIKDYSRSEEYLIMLLSQSGVHLYEAINDGIVKEIRNEDFPFSENRHYNTHHDKGSDPKHLDDLVREFLNKVDKALVKVHHATDLQCIVICTEDNYSRLMQVADKPSVYHGYSNIDYVNTKEHQIVEQAYEMIKEIQSARRAEAIAEMKEAVAQGKVVTDLREIYQAAKEGRGDLLIVHQNYIQPVLVTGKDTFEITENAQQENTIEDITSTIAWEVLSKKGRVIFTSQDEIKDLGKIVLKTRY